MLVRADGSIFFANPAAAESFGYKRAELLDLLIERLVPALDRETRAAIWNAPEAVRHLSNVACLSSDGTELRMDVRAIRGGSGEGEPGLPLSAGSRAAFLSLLGPCPAGRRDPPQRASQANPRI